MFIEVKIDGKIKLPQVQKYLLLQAQMDIERGEKQPYLLFLTKNEFKGCWEPRSEALTADDVQHFLKQKTNDIGVPDRLVGMVRDKNAIERYGVVRQDVKYGRRLGIRSASV